MANVFSKPHENVIFQLPCGIEIHVAIDEDSKLKIQCANSSGPPALAIEPKADNAILLTTRQ